MIEIFLQALVIYVELGLAVRWFTVCVSDMISRPLFGKKPATLPDAVRHSKTTYMANIHQEQPSIRNMQVVSSNRVHSTHSCEANKCRIFKPFFLFIR